MERQSVFKALGDPSRYAIYLELSRSAGPLSTTEVAERLALHPNTVRPHLERLREVGVVEMSTDSVGSVGRPQHRWVVPAGAPGLGIEPSAYRLLAHLLAEVAAEGRSDAVTLRDVGRRAGSGGEWPRPPVDRSAPACVRTVLERLADLGFDPGLEGTSSVVFGRCPFRELATAYPDLVCTLHRGLSEGIVADAAAQHGGRPVHVSAFNSLVDADPCRMELTSG